MKKVRKSSIVLAIISIIAVCCSIAIFAGCDTHKEVTLTFMNGDDVFYQVKGKPGDDIGNIGLPVKTGYEFDGWSIDGADYSVPDVMPSQTTTVTAEFTPITYTVKFNSGAGNGVEREIEATYDQSFSAPENAKTFYRNEAYVLSGWALTFNADAAEYSLNETFINLTAQKNAVVTVYAYYSPKPTENGFYGEGDALIAYTGSDSVVTLPDKYTTVAEDAFAYNTRLREVIVPDTYTEIEFGAFTGCDNLEKITVPFIGGSADENKFLAYIFGAAAYTDNTFSYNVVVEGTGSVDESTLTGSFYIPRSLRIVVINTPITEIPEGAFYYAYGLEKVIAYKWTDDEEPDDSSVYTYRIKTIGASAFEGCHNLGYDYKANAEYYMQWLVGVETIGDKAFKGYVATNGYFTSSMRQVGTLESIVTIGAEAFEFNNGISYIRFGEKLERIGESAFSSVNLLQRVIIPESCTYIGDGAFDGCLYLSSVTIGSNVEYIGEGAFADSATLTEVFFNGSLPASLANDAFYGFDILTEGSPFLTDTNPGTVFYFKDEATRAASASTITAHYPTAKTAVTGVESKPYYYANGSNFDFYMTFSAGHTMIIHDPYYRTGFGIPEIIGTYDKMTDVWYDAEIYNFNVLIDNNFTITLSYYLSQYMTHYYLYQVDTFDMENVEMRNNVTFTVGNKDTDEWYLEENKYGQIGLWHNGTMVEIQSDKGATYAVGGVEQTYEGNKLRTFVYEQRNKYFETVVSYKFVYTPDASAEDGEFTYYGTLHLDNDYENKLFGYYYSSDESVKVFVDEQINRIEISKDGVNLASGTYTAVDGSSFGKHETKVEHNDDLNVDVEVNEYYDYVLKFTDGVEYTVTFTDFLEQVTDGTVRRDIYARVKMTIAGENYVLYNSKHASLSDSYYINRDGSLSTDHYNLRQYEQYVYIDLGGGDGWEYNLYPGFGEHFYTIGSTEYHDYLTYEYVEGESGMMYNFQVEGGIAYTANVTDSFVGTFSSIVPNSGSDVKRSYSPFYEIEKDEVFSNGVVSIKLSGYGTAVYTDADGNEISGKYNISSSDVVAQVFVAERQYYNLLEYVFRSDDGNTTVYFVPNLYDAYDGTAKKGELILPDAMRNKSYAVFDDEMNVTAIIGTTGYGMAIMYVLKAPDGTLTPTNSLYFAPATYAYYTLIGDNDGKPLYRLTNGLDMGFFTFTPTSQIYMIPAGLVNGAEIGDEYSEWWRDTAALTVTAKLDVKDEQYMTSREEAGVYGSPVAGYTFELDGNGHATLKNGSAVALEGTFVSVDAGLLGTTEYPVYFTVTDGTKYKGVINVLDSYKNPGEEWNTYYNANIRFESIVTGENDKGEEILQSIDGITVGSVVLNNFAKGEVKNYTGSEGTVTIYSEGKVGLYKDGKYDYGTYEKDEKTGQYTCRLDTKKLIVTVSDDIYTLVKSFARVQMREGDYSSIVYYTYNPDEDTEYVEILGYKVRAENGKPVQNRNSEYSGTLIDTKNMLYWYQSKLHDLDIVLYEDGELFATYALLDIISITNDGVYTEEHDLGYTDKNDDPLPVFAINRGNAIVLYVYGGVAQG